MEVSQKAKERFCKDCNIPIKIFQEPYFTDRLILYDKFYRTMEKWDIFLRELGKYKCEQGYFEEYNLVKDTAILDIKSTVAYQEFNEEDMNKYAVTHKNLPNKDIYKPSNDGKCFISIDMRKANFSSLRYYNADIFGGVDSWEDFLRKYTDNEHILNSKYIRQVILGNCNPKRHITYEKFIMDAVLTHLDVVFDLMGRVVLFSNDEIVLDLSDLGSVERESMLFEIRDGVRGILSIPLKVELFVLHKITGTAGYYKEITDGGGKVGIEFKCLDTYEFPFVMRRFCGEDITENDKVFYHEGMLAKFLDIPTIIVNDNERNLIQSTF